MFCGIELAARIERAEARLIAGAARGGFVSPVAGGVACFARPGSPYNKVAGLGFDGLPDLEPVERAFAQRGAPVQVEVAHLGDPALSGLLIDRGYRLEGFENVLGRELRDVPEQVGGIEIRRDDDLDAWLDVVVDATLVADEQGVPSHEEFPRETLVTALRDFFSRGEALRYSAWLDGEPAGGASFRIDDGIAQMTGAATAPAKRRRGVQTALFAARLKDAAEAGCDVAVVTTQPASKSHENAQRQGFELLYTRAVWVS
ncbi:GNAT family N-acetyltransferase [Solirubrobacter soli]|uniref:GNAT family N-acetyltransferase n=1 Tax=Solirubrobacter soli TaxID=363832 RepID=UPI0003F9D281|nr:GNAT family N-acetyltransferase [Solirubrobacter soli]